MKRLLWALLTTTILNGCGGPGVVAYTRGLLLEREADQEFRKTGIISNASKAKYFKAVEQFNSALHFAPDHALSYYHRGICRARLEQQEAALEDFSKTVSLEPDNAEAWQDRANIYTDMGKFEEAIKDYDAADNLLPDQDRTYAGRSYCYLHLGNLQAALNDAQKAVELEPTAANFCAVGNVQRDIGNFTEMNKAYTKAFVADPHRISTYQTRGFARFIIGQYKLALSDFQIALKLSNWHGEDTPYAVIYGSYSARMLNQNSQSEYLLNEGVRRLNLPVEVDKNARNAQVADWPKAIIQYLHGDIKQDSFLRAALGDKNRMTEAHCTLGLEALLKEDKSVAKQQFEWVLESGRRDYIEFDIAKHRLKEMQAADKVSTHSID